MALIGFAEVVNGKFRTTERIWRGFVIDIDDPEKLGRVRVFVPRILDAGDQGEVVENYLWARPHNPENVTIPALRAEVAIWFGSGDDDPSDIIYGPPLHHTDTFPNVTAGHADTIREWNNFLAMLQKYRAAGVQSPEEFPHGDDENQEPLFDTDFLWEIDPDNQLTRSQLSVTPITVELKEPTLAGVVIPEPVSSTATPSNPNDTRLRLHHEGYPEISIRTEAQEGGWDKENRKSGSVQGIRPNAPETRPVAHHRDRYGNVTFNAPRIDVNPCPNWNGPDEAGTVNYQPERGQRSYNRGNWVSGDTFVNGYPVVLGGGSGGSFWVPRPVSTGEVPPGDPVPTEFDFKVVASHVNGRHIPTNRDEIFTLAAGERKQVWVSVALNSREVVSCEIDMGDDFPDDVVADGIPQFAYYHLFEISADENGVNYDYPEGWKQYVYGPLTLIFQLTEIANSGRTWEVRWFAGG